MKSAEEIKVYMTEWRRANPDKCAEYGRRWRSANPGKDVEYDRKRKYNLPREEYEAMVIACSGLCYLCGGRDENRALCVDHDHQTGKVRGLLCTICNTALKAPDNDLGWLDRAKEYLVA